MEEQRERLEAAIGLFESVSATYALTGGHAVSLYSRPRVTVDVDFLVAKKDLPRVRKAFEKTGHRLVKAGDTYKVLREGENPDEAEAVVELLPADLHPVWKGALESAIETQYTGLRVRAVSRAGLVALKFASASSTARPREDRLVDLADLLRLLRAGLSPAEDRAARALARTAYPGAAKDFDKLVDDLRHDRPITL